MKLDWKFKGECVLAAGDYRVTTCLADDETAWVAHLIGGDRKIHVGTLSNCLAACERHLRNIEIESPCNR